ncbi:MAG: Asp23/Gls24 family envelope stress response protein, partial [Clostridiales bacterium]|nr:Asp23/Gls24 family envelope stress response protein [Clostridiales bacterium]
NTQSAVTAVKDGGVTISIRLSIMPDTDIPELTRELQHSLKEYVERYSGISVLEIGILVEDASANPKSRVD